MAYQVFLGDATSPLRLPDWRKKLSDAYQLQSPDNRQYCPKEDSYVVTYTKFADKYNDAMDEPFTLRLLRGKHSEIFDCYQIGQLDISDLRTMLDAYLLSGVEYEHIAQHLSILRGTVDWYERMFFDIRDRLKSRMWLANYIINEYKYVDQDDIDTENNKYATMTQKQAMVYKLCGLYGGPLLVELMFTGFNNRAMPTHVDGISSFMDNTIKDFIRARGAMATRTLSNREENLNNILNLSFKVASTVQVENKTDFEEHMVEALDQLRWDLGSKRGNVLQAPTINNSIELRVQDIYKTPEALAVEPLLQNLEECSLSIKHEPDSEK